MAGDHALSNFDDVDVRVPEHVVFRVFDAETVLLNLATGTYHGLNPVGGRILELLVETGSTSVTASAVAAEYRQPLDVVARDVAELCAGLAARGLIDVGCRQSQ